MSSAADLASVLLQKDLENIATKLNAGGTLTSSERKLFEKMRSEGGSVPPPIAVPTPQTQEAAPPLHLTPLPSPANGDGSVSREQLDGWTKIYGIQHRQLRRLIARGREKKDPCPLDEPRKMPAWIEAHVEKVRSDLRDKVLAAAEAAGPEPEAAPTPAATAPDAPVPPPVPSGLSIDLASVGGVEGDQVVIFRRLFAAAKQELEAAYLGASEEKKTKLHSRIEKIGESLRKHEAAAEAKAKRRGELMSRPEVFTAIAEALNILRLMRVHRKKRILSRLPSLDPVIAEQIGVALDEIGDREEAIFNNLPVVKDADDLLHKLAA